MPSTKMPLSELLNHLQHHDPTLEPNATAELLSRVDPEDEEITKRAQFSDAHYSRHLIQRTPLTDVILVCWQGGQFTEIHDHAGQMGWVRVLEGTLNEEELRPNERSDPEANPLELVPVGRLNHSAGPGVVRVTRDRAWHRLGNPSRQRATSLHIYSRPHDRCRVLSNVTGEFHWKDLSFDSEAS